ncbi:hypothetical protein DPMN_053938 [Dreissena polymorpha]|uniref:Uncharacterized protein n=1 Tax=Dreissena polymorpha TaxID=45954 RepID=A0A9D4HPA5_DREPO|nr:hypothetical protein DPMN_053938 [Dreissena polymorpha]
MSAFVYRIRNKSGFWVMSRYGCTATLALCDRSDLPDGFMKSVGFLGQKIPDELRSFGSK